ncbi:MAG: type IV pilus modification protein PilV [Moraxella sp.]|uniref:type IV pilus modification protein PilV n=1 Tax=Moraxella sp. TaxID=479 RepID=UPI0026DAB53B|nr:type IV pilus modification protein PilV [Moraxella sp.]MDO4449687.1 type IV pilus modification protein PilV [Moraxella sp.]
MKLTSQQHQAGIGLIEVLVALLILAVAILGFSALQMNALRTTDESILRSRAMTVMRSGAEVMRLHHDVIDDFKSQLNSLQGQSKATPDTDCMDNDCTFAELAQYDATMLHNYAFDNEVQINIDTCAGTSGNQTRQCMIVSWGDTQPDFNGNTNSCANANGLYQARATCFIMEAY